MSLSGSLSAPGSQKVTFLRDATGLVREFGPLTAFVISFNYIVGGGVYAFSVQQVNGWPGSLPWLGLLIAMIPVSALGFVYIWLGTAMPRSGGEYLYISRLVHPFAGWIVTWGFLATRLFVVGTLMFSDAKLFGTAFTIMGLQTKNDGLLSFGKFLGTDNTAAVVGAIILMLTIYVFVILGGKAYRYLVWTIFVVPVAGGLLTILLAGINPFNPTSFRGMWDSVYGAGAYQEIVNLATNNGWKQVPISLDATMAALSASIFAFGIAPFASTQFGGEIKNPRVTFWVAIAGSILVGGIYMAVLAGSALFASGEFVAQYDYVYYGSTLKSQLKINPGLEPTIPVFLVGLAANPVLGLLVVLGGAFSLYHVVPSTLMASPRYFVAMAFDRFFPQFLADVSDRFHTPVKAITVLVIGGILGLGLRMFFNWTTGLVAYGIIVPAVWAFMGLAGILLPYRMPRIYEAVRYVVSGTTGHAAAYVVMGVLGFVLGLIMFGTGNVVLAIVVALIAYPVGYLITRLGSNVSGRQVGQVPIVVLAGLVGGVFGGYMSLDQFVRSLATAGGRESVYFTVGTLIVGLLVYAYYYWRNKQQGVDIKYIYSEIPPE